MERNTSEINEPFKMSTSIKYKIMLIIILVIFIALSASTYIALVTGSKIFHASLIEKGQNLTHNIAVSTKSAFLSRNWLSVEDLLHDSVLNSHDDIIYAKIIKPTGEVYLATEKIYIGQQVSPKLLRNKESIINDHYFLEEKVGKGILLVLPVSIETDTWYIHLGLSTDAIHQALNTLITKNIILGVILFMLSATVFFFLSRSISQPIIDLANATKTIVEGKRDHYIQITSKDEIGFLGHSFNKMTQRIENAEKALKASNDRFITVLDSIDATIYVADLDTKEILFMNRAMKLAFGAQHEGQLCYKAFGGQNGPCTNCNNRKLIDKEGMPTDTVFWEGLNPVNKRWYANYDRVIQWIDDRLVHLQISFDITETKELDKKRRETELQLRQSQKMEAIGKLAGGVAHDLNNILSGIINYPELILLDLPEDHKLRKPIKNIQKAGERATTIVNDLLTLARRGVVVSRVVDLNEVIRDYLLSPEHDKLLSFHPQVKVNLSLADDLEMIKGSPVHLSKAVMNLVSNASEAMPQGGRIHIRSQNIYLKEAILGYETIEPNTYVLLIISDEGIGIAQEEQKKIFEPFYTKKVMGRSGTGLGMAVIWGTIKDHFGYIDLKSSSGTGTAFYIYLPVTKEKMPQQPVAQNEVSSLNGKGETILVVDDIEEQRELACEMLHLLDYQVTTVASGEEAVEYLKHHAVDLIIVDMIMDPGINGLETYKRIIQFKPGQRALIASGYSESDEVKEALKLGVGQYLRKPYNISTIAKAIQKELKVL
jgi:signal transduction histidine kinase/ActR/RegA family two-component response regulator/HAMP domain-containing protein